MYCAVIADIIRSKSINARFAIQKRLEKILDNINTDYDKSIASKFMITLGDEFQGLLNSPVSVLDMIERIKLHMYPLRIRFGIGFGEIFTGINKEIPLGADGPAYYNAREMIDDIKKSERAKMKYCMDIKFCSNDIEKDNSYDRLINTGLSLCSFLESKWTNRQREIITGYILSDNSQKNTSMKFGVAQSTIQRSLRSSGFYNYLYAKNEIQNALNEKWRG